MTDLSSIKALVFDAYGTLFDVHSAVAAHRDRVGANADAVSAAWRAKQLEYTWLRSLMGRYVDFWQVTGDGLDYALDMHDQHDTAVREALMNAYLSLSCYPEVPRVLGMLKRSGYRTAILSNGSPAMLGAAVDNAGIGADLDAVLSVEEVGIFKPDPRVYQLAVDRLGVGPGEILFQSSNAWDACGAATFGFRVAWINRFGQRRERLPDGPDFELSDLDALPGLLGLDPS